ncbi:hypothetical protein D0862_12132 [Hortaea werneckii]|uniref:Uncharacterized protein n=1 Tax=Hortaea werneckii TaxID=91943 RepID=A0A3M7F147_HORWE|nr:hypothetical protein D0862_12132 [Hortaea werneckii]
MTRSLPWTPAHYAGLIDPQPREPGNGSTFKSPNRPRPPKPVQPRDDGCSRIPNACFAAAATGGNDGPQPRDPGNGRRMRVDPQPRDPGNGRLPVNRDRRSRAREGGGLLVAWRRSREIQATENVTTSVCFEGASYS